MLFLCVHWLSPMADSDIASERTKVTSDLAIAFSDLTKNCLLFIQKGFYSQIHLIIIPFSNKFINANKNLKRDPFHMLIVCDKNVMKWGVVVGHNRPPKVYYNHEFYYIQASV